MPKPCPCCSALRTHAHRSMLLSMAALICTVPRHQARPDLPELWFGGSGPGLCPPGGRMGTACSRAMAAWFTAALNPAGLCRHGPVRAQFCALPCRAALPGSRLHLNLPSGYVDCFNNAVLNTYRGRLQRPSSKMHGWQSADEMISEKAIRLIIRLQRRRNTRPVK